jgi:pimeloyl-ACP methyl ester carboxylesterase
LPEITRAIILVHGLKRNVESTYRTLEESASMAGSSGHGSLLIAPQFLNESDVAAYRLPADVLRWRKSAWESGQPAAGPAPVSSFEVLDALIEKLCDRTVFPNLKTIVVAGHSAGGQIVQRYAVVGKAVQLAASNGIRVRYVVANPSSYVYFSNERPDNAVAPFRFTPSQISDCANLNQWKYGVSAGPPYVGAVTETAWVQIEEEYARRDVIYLLGTADTDPHHPELDRSCGGEAEGPTRFVRGQAYFAYLRARHMSGWNQRLWYVPHVGHSADEMFTSTCGLASLFDRGSCQDR